jgi:Uma2 family endonuclease
MRAELRPQKLTYRDYLLFPEDGRRHEIIEGEHCVSAAPTSKHQIVLGRLHRALGVFTDDRELGEVLSPPMAVVLSEFDIVEPDLVFVSRERLLLIDEARLNGAPDLAVEVLSPSTRGRDLSNKLRLYERAGVTEYWVLDPVEDSVEVYGLNEGGYRREARFSAQAGDILSSALFPGWSLSLARLFRPL